MPPCLAIMNEKTGTPLIATVVMLAATAVIAFFTLLGILSNLLSISSLFILMLVAIGLLVRRYYVSGVTTKANRIKFIVFLALILGSSIGTAIYWASSTDHGWIGYAITLPIWLLSTFGLWLFAPQAREPKFWGVPLVPRLPSLSIAINIFLLGSIDKKSFEKFGIFTLVMIVYYFLYGLHASYGTAKEASSAKQMKNVEEGGLELEI
uniref:Cationic amino acid transporter C-terminal domain-containing protein n=1 Tax=Quercus lobata TaxID=97700 RepID=A0A7N2LR23_QUELO